MKDRVGNDIEIGDRVFALTDGLNGRLGYVLKFNGDEIAVVDGASHEKSIDAGDWRWCKWCEPGRVEVVSKATHR